MTAGALAGTLVIASCTSSREQSAPGEAIPKFSAADVSFMQGMIGHHAQAVVMAQMAPSHGASPAVLTLCKKIDISQRDEITMMRQWLALRKQAVPDSTKPMVMLMPGMLTDAQMKQLAAAHETAFDRLFLTFMIQHHEGALTMVKSLFASPGGGQASEMFRYASDVNSDQTAEIERMQQMLNALSRSSVSTAGSFSK
jgi:uncharacterized protein (DUF305 family)